MGEARPNGRPRAAGHATPGATPPGRVPDSGDLLLGFFEVGHGIAARALAELEYDSMRSVRR